MVCVKVELFIQNRKAGATLSAMNKITQDIEFMQSPDSKTAKERLALWLYHAENSHIPEFEACIKTMHNWSEYILNSFGVPYSNRYTEGCNNKTKVLKRVCFGVRNFDSFRNRILHCA